MYHSQLVDKLGTISADDCRLSVHLKYCACVDILDIVNFITPEELTHKVYDTVMNRNQDILSPAE